MDLADVALFLRVVRLGSVTEAARLAGLTQPTASRRIRRLELDLGEDLFTRDGRALTPTRSGLQLLGFAQRVLAEEDHLRRALEGGAPARKSLLVAASTAPGETFVPGLLAAYAKEREDALPELFIMDSQAVERCVADGTCDVGFTGRRPSPGLLKAQEVARDEVLLAVPRGHPVALRGEISPNDLLQETFVERMEGSGTRRTVEERLSALGIPFAERRIALTVSSAQSLLSAVRSGTGVGFVSALALRAARDDTVVGARIAGLPIRRLLYLTWDPHRTAETEGFVAFALRHAGELAHA